MKFKYVSNITNIINNLFEWKRANARRHGHTADRDKRLLLLQQQPNDATHTHTAKKKKERNFNFKVTKAMPCGRDAPSCKEANSRHDHYRNNQKIIITITTTAGIR